MQKTIVTNRAALSRRYGNDLAALDAALERMVSADRERKVLTEVVDLGVDAADRKANKERIDEVVRTSRPSFLLILGGPDIVPHQNLTNPLAGTGDPDEVIPSDLPYASAAPYSPDPAAFLAPSLAVGRIPDAHGDGAAGLARVLDRAAAWKSRPRIDYADPFSVSAQAWEHSTARSLLAAFHSNAGMATTPDRGPQWSDAELAKRSYFINCRGERATPKFFGESADGDRRPVALESASLEGRLSEGAVAAIECGYAGELYEGSFTSAFLRNGGYGCLVSTSATYGSAETNEHADILTQQFMANVMNGMTLGHAALNARLSFVQARRAPGPIDLKTLAQFYLAGDPSIQPVGELGLRVHAARGAAVPFGHFTPASIVAGTEMLEAVPASHRK